MHKYGFVIPWDKTRILYLLKKQCYIYGFVTLRDTTRISYLLKERCVILHARWLSCLTSIDLSHTHIYTSILLFKKKAFLQHYKYWLFIFKMTVPTQASNIELSPDPSFQYLNCKSINYSKKVPQKSKKLINKFLLDHENKNFTHFNMILCLFIASSKFSTLPPFLPS